MSLNPYDPPQPLDEEEHWCFLCTLEALWFVWMPIFFVLVVVVAVLFHPLLTIGAWWDVFHERGSVVVAGVMTLIAPAWFFLAIHVLLLFMGAHP